MKKQTKAKKSVKVIVKPYYIGESSQGEIFRRVIIAEIQRKLKLREIAVSNNKYP